MEKTENPLAAAMPFETTYELNIFGNDGQGIHEIQMSREEFVSLKKHLARMRGFPVPAEDEGPAATEKQAGREHAIGFLRDRISDHKIAIALLALKAIARNTGADTPAESFLCALIRESADGLTPESVQDDLQTFQEEFAAVAENCEYAHRFYPELAMKAAKAAQRAKGTI